MPVVEQAIACKGSTAARGDSSIIHKSCIVAEQLGVLTPLLLSASLKLLCLYNAYGMFV